MKLTGVPQKNSSIKRTQLPNPAEYYESEGLEFTGNGEWKNALCPFHEDTKPSLRVRLDRGCFCCMACGAKGGDVLDFHRKKYQMSFADAHKALIARGGWK